MQPTSGSEADDSRVGRGPLIWLIQAGLAIYLLPVVAVVVAVGGAAIAVATSARTMKGWADAMNPSGRRRRPLLATRHGAHVARTAERIAERTGR